MAQQPSQPIDYKALAARHGAIASIHERDLSSLPPEVERIKQSLGPQFVQGKHYGNAVATVGEHEPHKIEINDIARFNKSPQQVLGHELTHLLFNQLSGTTMKAIPADNPHAPYDISNVDALRKQGKKLWQLPQEQAATIVQTYVADPSQRVRLGPWITDLNNAPLSIMQPTGPTDKTINRNVRPPAPPVQVYLSPQELRAQAAASQKKLTGK